MVDRHAVGVGASIDEEGHLMNEIGVVGLGVVGGALKEALEAKGIGVAGYDPYLGVGAPERLSGCSIVFLCVPTPSAPGGEFDATAVWKAVRDVEADLADGTIVAVKSTVPPGTSDALALDFPRFEFASVPEFLVAARPLESLTKPDRILIGARTARAAEAIAETMRGIAPGAPVLILSPIEAELAKLFANAMLAAKVSMANELALICERYGVAWANVQPAVGLDRRIGPDHLTVTPERGFGGGCFPKDLDGLIAAANQAGHEARLLSALSAFNRLVRESIAGPNLKGPDQHDAQ
jgi:UDPglucose 6-dehydrogenase